MQHRQTLKPESQILRFPAPSDGASETQHCRTLLVLSGGGGGGGACACATVGDGGGRAGRALLTACGSQEGQKKIGDGK